MKCMHILDKFIRYWMLDMEWNLNILQLFYEYITYRSFKNFDESNFLNDLNSQWGGLAQWLASRTTD